MTEHWTNQPKYTECACKDGDKYPAPDCRYHASVAGRRLMDAHLATKRLIKFIENMKKSE
jgi:hypothetical protein